MRTEATNVFIENIAEGDENGAWMHKNALIASEIIPRAYCSDLGILRLRVNDLEKAMSSLQEQGYQVTKKSGVLEVVQIGTQGFNKIAKILQNVGMKVESTTIIPGIYQG